jgi:hypothetical protein
MVKRFPQKRGIATVCSRSNPSHPNLNLMVIILKTRRKSLRHTGRGFGVLRLKPCPVYNHLFACSRFSNQRERYLARHYL